VQYGGSYEQAKFAGNTAEGITAVAVGIMAGMVSVARASFCCGAVALALRMASLGAAGWLALRESQAQHPSSFACSLLY
jgi:hypothetical protein